MLLLELDGNKDQIRIIGKHSWSSQPFHDTFDGSKKYQIVINKDKIELGGQGVTIVCMSLDNSDTINRITILPESNMTVGFQGTCPKDYEIFSIN